VTGWPPLLVGAVKLTFSLPFEGFNDVMDGAPEIVQAQGEADTELDCT
jgi:hypothetical protein